MILIYGLARGVTCGVTCGLPLSIAKAKLDGKKLT